MKSLVAIREQSFAFLTTPDARQHSCWGMSCLVVCHPHLMSNIVLTAVWAQACKLEHKTPLSYHASLVGAASRSTSSTGYPDLLKIDNFGLCVGEVATVSRHCHFCERFRDERSTGDVPHYVAKTSEVASGQVVLGLTRTQLAHVLAASPPPHLKACDHTRRNGPFSLGVVFF